MFKFHPERASQSAGRVEGSRHTREGLFIGRQVGKSGDRQ